MRWRFWRRPSKPDPNPDAERAQERVERQYDQAVRQQREVRRLRAQMDQLARDQLAEAIEASMRRRRAT